MKSMSTPLASESMATLSIIICTWNRAGLLATTLTSLAQQVIAPGLQVEVIVVDNNSGDNTRAMVERMIDAWPLGTLRYAFEARQGKQFALNRGIALSAHQVLAFTDDDIIFPTDWVGAIERLFRDPALQLAGGKTLLHWPADGAPRWWDPNMSAVLGGVDLGEQQLDVPPPGYAPAGANMIARRTLIDQVGMFSEAHFRHMDQEFGTRCAGLGIRIVYAPAVLVYAPVDPDCLSKRYFRRWAFKAGIVHDTVPQPGSLPAVPRWCYRALLQDLLRWPADCLFRTPAAAFSRELRIWRNTGTIASIWCASLWPQRFPQWVEHYSQKKKNLY